MAAPAGVAFPALALLTYTNADENPAVFGPQMFVRTWGNPTRHTASFCAPKC